MLFWDAAWAVKQLNSSLMTELWGAAEFPHHDDERVAEQASSLEIVDQAGQGQVQRWGRPTVSLLRRHQSQLQGGFYPARQRHVGVVALFAR